MKTRRPAKAKLGMRSMGKQREAISTSPPPNTHWILDVGFGLGLPESALQRVLTAPGAAPAGLEPLGRLILAVEDSHGQAELKTNDGWGITLTVTLLRAHPRAFVAAHEGGKPAAQQNVIAIGRAGPK
ncbi:hypothetical protein [Sorangium sp. So ce341]|uniref:hypothetical protein n=1 Tax=Sorangium sp. So ce341 TaxID=3133302 RepID=UPI003F62EEEB